MKQINGIGGSAVSETQLTRTTLDETATTTKVSSVKAAPSSSIDSAQLSTTALLMQQNAGADDVRYEKVATIKASIDAGTYGIPAAALADKLIETLLQ